jgi:hypothetical protein
MRAALAGIAVVVGLGGLWFYNPDENPGIDPIISASISPDKATDFTISNISNRAACLVVRGRATTAHSHILSPGKDCESVWPGLTSAKNWTQNDDGTVVLTDASGAAILTLGLGDGVDYESLEPANAIITVTSAS